MPLGLRHTRGLTMRFRNLRAIVLALLVTVAPAALATLPMRDLSIRGHRLQVEVADTVATQQTGLMNRFSLQPDHGMLFVFPVARPQGFWMKDTYIPLSVAFVDSQGRILNIEDMRPQDESTHWSQGPALYAIEMLKGWFVDRGIGPGDVVEGLAPK